MARHDLPIKTTARFAAVLLSGCVSLDQAAPRVETFAAQPSGEIRVQLERGRTLYITKCAKCHSPEPVRKYSSFRWEDILQEMNQEAKLDETDARAVRAYVFAALRS